MSIDWSCDFYGSGIVCDETGADPRGFPEGQTKGVTSDRWTGDGGHWARYVQTDLDSETAPDSTIDFDKMGRADVTVVCISLGLGRLVM